VAAYDGAIDLTHEPAEREFLRRRRDDAARHGGPWPPAAE
jgi:predicted RNA polymerase sigma factor